jgi:hypothetical protein
MQIFVAFGRWAEQDDAAYRPSEPLARRPFSWISADLVA